MSTSKSNRWVLIVGAAGGIGSACSERLSGDGFGIVGIDRNLNEISPLFRDFIHADLIDYDKWTRELEHRINQWGVPFSVVLCSGVYPRCSLLEYDSQKAEMLVRNNFLAPLELVRWFIPFFQKSGGGSFVFITSQAGVTGGFDGVYAATKGALTSLMKSVAREFARDGVRANAVSPGPVETPMAEIMPLERRIYYESIIPIGRFSKATEVASAVAWLHTADANAINGITIDVDGGLVRR